MSPRGRTNHKRHLRFKVYRFSTQKHSFRGWELFVNTFKVFVYSSNAVLRTTIWDKVCMVSLNIAQIRPETNASLAFLIVWRDKT